MLIAVSGSQGSGKSTVLGELKKRGFNTIDRKSSRSILEDWGVTLQEVNSDAELTLKFQDEITTRKFEDEIDAVVSKQTWFTERTHADLFTYALASIGENNTHCDWLNAYYNTCLHHNQDYDGVFYLRGGLFPVEYDGTRGSNSHYSHMIDLTMEDMTKQMIHSSKIQVIETANLQNRVNTIALQSQALIKNI